ncbi:MAG TPA: SDR family NAD(P)-dependent oxidoreductase [Anaeromyxobacter sp.]|nr:SDR family NAD(P)-dependent oxidoreductase [Anaeromyxobacter sp.]
MPTPGDPKPSPPAPAALGEALRLLERAAADPGVLAGLSAEERTRLQKAAGELARPGPEGRRRLRRALARRDRQAQKARDGALRRATGIQGLRRVPAFPTPPPIPAPEGSSRGAGPELCEPRKCYVCKSLYHQLHHFYDQLCPACGDESFARRSATADLRGRVALVSGARVKIGYQAAILLLRAGCRVVSLTRFPRDAAARYAREPDFATWRDRLSIQGIDLRHTPSVERLCQHLCATLPRLDFQIHNACQTVRRPPGFYAHLLEEEKVPLPALPADQRPLLEDYEDFRSSLAGRAAGLERPALLSQAQSAAGLALPGQGPIELFPQGLFDQDQQQIDLRPHNSWRLALHEVPSLELLEVLLVNAAAPFVMAARLKQLMLREREAPPNTATSADPAKHLVMVSAMEGQFYRRHKTDRHPHTNMAKAALNMLVRTSASDLVRDGIHLNAVDTGWVTDEDPVQLAAHKAEEHGFSPPLDVVDGAARVLAPLFEGFRTGHHSSGTFFKDFRAAPW